MQKMRTKHSKKREAILRAMRSTTAHPSAQRIYEELRPWIPSLSLGTVYRNINFFVKEGSVVSVGVVNGEERFDARTEPHPHLVCVSCGKVCDILCPDPQAMGGISGLHAGIEGFQIDYRKTVFYGICGDCEKKAEITENDGLAV
jgi:Fur family peroxide stress response transcriptional regulator